MREGELNGRKVTYPDELCFAFNRNIVTVSATVDVTFIIMTSPKDGTSYTDVRSPINGKVEIDLSGYMQLFFNALGEGLMSDKNMLVKLQAGAGSFQFFTRCIWGAVNIGETFNAGRRVTWFRQFPFTFSIFLSESDKVYKRYAGERYEQTTIDGLNLLHLNPEEMFPDASTECNLLIETGGENSSVFDVSYDYSFRGYAGAVTNTLVVSDCTEGVYLRWIDRHGFYQYYLFREGKKSEESKIYGDTINIQYNDDKYDYYGVEIPQGKSVKKSMKICAPLVDKESFAMLSTLPGSPLVHRYVDGTWVPVQVANATLQRGEDELQDFEVQINLPETITQKL